MGGKQRQLARFPGADLGRFLCVTPQLADDTGKVTPVDEPHRIIGNAFCRAGGKYGNNVGMAEAGGGLGLDPKPLEMSRIERGSHGQNLERDAPAERELRRFVDDSHAAPTDLAEEPEVADLAEGRNWNALAW